MTHLSPTEIVELVEGRLSPDRAVHADACERCRREVEGARALLAEVRGLEVPEPSPLFWEHFSARVRELVAAERAPRPAIGWAWGTAAAALATLALLVVAAVVVSRGRAGLRTPPAAVAEVAGPTGRAWPAGEGAVPAATEDDWEVLTALLAELGWDDAQDAAAFSVRPGAADQALAMLDEGERAELVKLLRREVRGDTW